MLQGLDLSKNNFEHIDRYLLDGLPSLRRFDMSRNALKLIEPSTFVGSPFLEHVNISRNDLQFLNPLTFIQLQKLFDLDVSYNNLSQVNYEGLKFSGTEKAAGCPLDIIFLQKRNSSPVYKEGRREAHEVMTPFHPFRAVRKFIKAMTFFFSILVGR